MQYKYLYITTLHMYICMYIFRNIASRLAGKAGQSCGSYYQIRLIPCTVANFKLANCFVTLNKKGFASCRKNTSNSIFIKSICDTPSELQILYSLQVATCRIRGLARSGSFLENGNVILTFLLHYYFHWIFFLINVDSKSIWQIKKLPNPG